MTTQEHEMAAICKICNHDVSFHALSNQGRRNLPCEHPSCDCEDFTEPTTTPPPASVPELPKFVVCEVCKLQTKWCKCEQRKGTNMTTQELRAAAETEMRFTEQPCPADHPMYRIYEPLRKRHRMLAEHALATTDPALDEPVDEQWLREEWGELGGEIDMQSGRPVFVHPDLTGCLSSIVREQYDYRVDGMILTTITTRRQFIALMEGLGIEKPQPNEDN